MNDAAESPRRPLQWLLPFSLPLLLILISDLWSKAAVFAHTQTHIIDGRLRIVSDTDFTWWIVPAWNTGVAWSLFADSPWFIVAITVILVPLLIVVYLTWYRNHHTFVDTAFGLVIGGALGNAWDRFLTHLDDSIYGVRDFLAFTIPVVNYQWPTFNIADAGISCGFVMLLIASFIQERRARQAALNTPSGSDDKQQ